MKGHGFIAGALLLTAAVPAGAEIELYSAASTALPQLEIPLGPRSVAMGETGLALGQGVYSMGLNPAALNLVTGPQAGFAHNEWNSELALRREWIGGAMPQRKGVAALGLEYFSLGEVEFRSATGELTGTGEAGSMAAQLGYAMALFSPAMHWGASLGWTQQTFGDSSQMGITASLGGLYQQDRWSFGFALMRVGTAPEGSSLPSAFGAGGSFLLLNKAMALSVDMDFPFGADPALKAGAEYAFLSRYAVRAGYRAKMGGASASDESGITAGFGAHFGGVQLDYAFVPFGDLATTHRVAATLDFDQAWFNRPPGPPRADDSNRPAAPAMLSAGQVAATKQAAKILYQEGMNHLKKGQRLEALLSFRQSLEVDPDQPKVRTEIEKITKWMEDSRKQGGKSNPNVAKMITKQMAKGDRLFKRGDYHKAIAEYQVVLELDRTQTKAEVKINQARQKVSDRRDYLLRQADLALNGGDLVKAVLRIREAEGVDPGSGEVEKRLRILSGRIQTKISQLHKDGIGLYVNGKVKEALKLWEDALKMDPKDPKDIQRDIKRAKQLLKAKTGGLK